MHNFFVNENQKQGDCFYIEGNDVNHIKNVLRMKKGETFLVSCNSVSSLCEIESLEETTVVARILEENYKNTDLPIKIMLFQGLPKGDKMEFIIQKAVELGVDEIIPTEMSRCVVKFDNKKKISKVARWQAIAESAAKQSKRSFVPKVSEVQSFSQMLEKAGKADVFILPYENKNTMAATKEALLKIKKGSTVAILIGTEGGFDEKEVKLAAEKGAQVVSLGKRILRTETAAMAAVAMCMLYCEMEVEE
ncbi:MAG: 16S rRNA (uracil(1498)-N(3))-methyltransferase [Clostridia bacterium]|nr:16S rRNA (uracil(1498)-N(3))-methyltransferase [Clostridia bacterium]